MDVPERMQAQDLFTPGVTYIERINSQCEANDSMMAPT